VHHIHNVGIMHDVHGCNYQCRHFAVVYSVADAWVGAQNLLARGEYYKLKKLEFIPVFWGPKVRLCSMSTFEEQAFVLTFQPKAANRSRVWRQGTGVPFSQGYLNRDKERTVRARA
jgi:hypothetical protein